MFNATTEGKKMFPELRQSNSSYGRWAVWFSENDVRYFWRKADALSAIREYGEEPFTQGPDTNF